MAPEGYFSRETPGRAVAGATEVRTVPSALYPTIASALPSGSGGSQKQVLVRILPGVYYEVLDITGPVILVGAGKSLPTIWGLRPEGVVISGTATCACALRNLRLCAEANCHAVSIRDASPLVEGCEIVGSLGEAARGARAGLDVRGNSGPVIRGCRIFDHVGAGITFSGSHGLVAACDITRCACGVWLEGDANPLIWRTTLAGHRGAGVVVRATGRGCIAGNTILRNGAGGLLVESSRRSVTTIVRNRVWANSGCDLRQSPAGAGRLAGQGGAVVLANTVGQYDGPSASCGIDLAVEWPQTVVTTARELRAAVKEAPPGLSVVKVQGRLELEEPLVLDRPVVLAGEPVGESGTDPERGELVGKGCTVVRCSATAVFWRLGMTVTAAGDAASSPFSRDFATISCLEVTAGQPVLVDCDLHSDVPTDALTHALWAGGGANALLFNCSLSGARGSGVSLVGASACLVKCQVKNNLQGGVLVAEQGNFLAESCDIGGNGHFGIVASEPGAVVVGRSDLTANAAGSLWHCGGETESGVVLLDQCSVSGSPAPSTNSASPAVVVGAFARLALWDCFAPTMKSGTLAAVIRAEAHSSALVAGDGPTLGWPGWTPKSRRSRPEVPTGPSIGKGVVSWLDVSGNPLSPVKEPSASRPSSASQSLQNWPAAWPRGRTTSTVSAFSELDKPDEPKPVEKDTQVEVPVDVSAEEPAEVPELETTVETATEVSEVPEEVSAPAEGHDAWLRLRMEGKAATFGTEADRVTLFEILQMLAVKDAHKEEVLDTVGLGGQIKPQDIVYLRGHTGRWITTKNSTKILCNAAERAQAATFVIEFKGSALKSDCRVGFKLEPAPEQPLWLGVLQSEVGLLTKGEGTSDNPMRFVVQTAGTMLSGTPVHLKSMATGKLVEVDGGDVRARSTNHGTRQRILVEKMPTGIPTPEPCGDLELTVEQRAWIYLRAAQCSLVDRQALARFLSSPKPHCKELLKAYTKLWESEWRLDWRAQLELEEEGPASSPGSRQSSRSGSLGPATTSDSSKPRARSQSRRRMSRTDWFLGIVGGVSSTTDDKSNGNLFVSAMRSFFANAIRMSQLEADPVQRVIEAFAEALVADAAFLTCFEASMLPEKERQTYRTPDEVLFGLAYTTLMLNTDMHNKQVAAKMWDHKKFVGAGKGCGVTGGLMASIYKNIQSEEI